MNKIANSLVVLFLIKCLVSFMMKEATIFDGMALFGCAVYISMLIHLSLPEDKEKRVK